jgi:SAM-dependent methyltransferase
VATDLRQIVLELSRFYDFNDKTVVDVGAGGGQLVEYARPAQRVTAVDKEAPALKRLAERLDECGLADKFTLLEGDFLDLRPRGDVVLFEFCLHQFADPARALAHARELAPEILVLDHATRSRWSFYAAEEGIVEAASKAVEGATIREQRTVDALQRFPDYAALETRLAAQGPTSLERIGALRGQKDIAIPMPYRLALL